MTVVPAAAFPIPWCGLTFVLLFLGAACSSCGLPYDHVEHLNAAAAPRGNSSSDSGSETTLQERVLWAGLQPKAPFEGRAVDVQAADAFRGFRNRHQEKGEERVVDRGSLIEGKYLLLELLHPPLWALKAADASKGEPSGLLQIHPGSVECDTAAVTDSAAAGSSSCFEESSGDQWPTRQRTPQSAETTRWLPGWARQQRLLLQEVAAASAVTTGAALAAAVVSVRSEVVISRQLHAGPEGFCVDPFIILRSFPFWFHPPSLPSPDASSTTGSSNNRSRYRLFGQLGGGAYGEVWRAVSLDSEAPFEETVLKRMRCEAIATQPNGEKLEQQQQLLLQQESARVRRGFAREVFFGLLLRGAPHVSRFVEVLPDGPSASSDVGAVNLVPAGEATAPAKGVAAAESEVAATAEGTSAVAESEVAAAAAAAFLPEMNFEDLKRAAESARQSCCNRWLVFANEGISLTPLFFAADTAGSGMLTPNALWWYLKASARLHPPPRRVRQFAAATAAAAAAAADAPFLPLLLQLQQNPSELLLFIRSVLQQLLQALQAAHALNVTHRDVKLENVLLQPSLPVSVRLVDWGSAASNDENSPVARALKALWGEETLSVFEESDGYQPPEVWAEAAAQAELEATQQQQKQQYQQQAWQHQPQKEKQQHQGQHCYGACVGSNRDGSRGSSSSIHDHRSTSAPDGAEEDGSNSSSSKGSLHRPPSYDIWGVGLIFLKLALGNPSPLEPLDGRWRAKLYRTYQGQPAAVLQQHLLLLALNDLCLIPWPSDRLPTAAVSTAVAAATPTSFFATVRSAVVSAAERFYLSWLDPDGGTQQQQQRRDLQPTNAAGMELKRKEVTHEDMGLDRQKPFALLSRLLGTGGSGEVVVRHHQRAVQPLLVLQQHQTVQLQRGLLEAAEDDGDPNNEFGEVAGTQQTRQNHQDCNDAIFAELLRGRDPAGVGVPNPLARDLLRKLLAFDPQERLSAEAALRHPWFSVSASAAGAVDEQTNPKP